MTKDSPLEGPAIRFAHSSAVTQSWEISQTSGRGYYLIEPLE